MNKIINLVMMTFCFTLFLEWEAKDPKSLGVVVGVGQIAIAQVTNSPITTNKIPETDLNTPPAVSANERMKTYPSEGEYVAFSLNAAMKQVKQTPANQNYRTLYPEIYNLGGINQLHGLVYDRKNKDVLLVGKYNPKREPITLDDLAVALRSRFVYGKWPLVSIDPTEQQKHLPTVSELKQSEPQVVRFEGGLEQTQFGADFLDADYRLKKMGMELLPTGISDFRTFWYLLHQYPSGENILSRFWFYPVVPSVVIRDEVVSITGLRVAVFTEVIAYKKGGEVFANPANFTLEAADKFAEEVSQQFEELSQFHPSFSRLHGLLELVALAKGMEDMSERPDLNFWLREYKIKTVETKKSLAVLVKGETSQIWMAGGVQFQALSLRLKSGDVSALKDAVLLTRPYPNSLTWTFVVGEWIIPTSSETINLTDLTSLFSHAAFLGQQQRYDEARAILDKIIALNPDYADAYLLRGLSRASNDVIHMATIDPQDQQEAIKDFNQTLQLNPNSALGYAGRALAYCTLGKAKEAIEDSNHALELNANLSVAYGSRGLAYVLLGNYQAALQDFNQFIELNPNSGAGIYYGRGSIYAMLQKYQKALEDFNQALELKPNYPDVYLMRGLAYGSLGHREKAMVDLQRAAYLFQQEGRTKDYQYVIELIQKIQKF
ncbi:MAG: tetratricopeptide repeat protein [Microcystis sp. M54BS1]|uniref:tetratricopeptide repeat protein n=1 Tax=unclassified Microcystis TaxID=2643300 RepID=UPI002580EA10|nr:MULTISPECIES: tetratricopeptide repeat protein [unclassified Microcystis]MCA2537705.1 tetratricopeptide repeat protein [Microcystis sp. M54BS1]MCA2596085.1 tetratricopeptide repeat protein [Microcystis sp. M38BS1]MCA2610782.1 tetratricopeptide repeat protein [Microcystis sp. M27BS1]MCA2504877.1 tetratricopeptide repeat protein [Microcystis sp. M62BS1]MCA2509487.1 tetratricopeptide repeat protein [Microcystis sp. M60BS1]